MIDNNKGFTLVEFLVAIVILMVGLLGMLQAINLAMGKTVETAFRNEAFAVANEELISKTGKSFSALSTSTASSWRLVRRQPRGIFKNYSVQTVVTQLTGVGLTGTPGSKQIDVNVRWKIKNNTFTHSISSVLSTSNIQ